MKSLFLPLFTIIFSFSLFISCDDTDNDVELCAYKETAYVTSVNAPAIGSVDEVLNIEVSFPLASGCGQFERFVVSNEGNTSTIEIIAAYIGCVCTLDAPTRTVNYEFSASKTGIYELKFKSSATEFITVFITIE